MTDGIKLMLTSVICMHEFNKYKQPIMQAYEKVAKELAESDKGFLDILILHVTFGVTAGIIQRGLKESLERIDDEKMKEALIDSDKLVESLIEEHMELAKENEEHLNSLD